MDSKLEKEGEQLVLHSWERSTGCGATHGARVWDGRDFVTLSRLRDARYLGREDGFYHMAIPIYEDDVWGDFSRSNSGWEEVVMFRGESKGE